MDASLTYFIDVDKEGLTCGPCPGVDPFQDQEEKEGKDGEDPKDYNA